MTPYISKQQKYGQLWLNEAQRSQIANLDCRVRLSAGTDCQEAARFAVATASVPAAYTGQCV